MTVQIHFGLALEDYKAYTNLVCNELEKIDFYEEPDVEILGIGLKSIFDPSVACGATDTLIENHRVAILKIKELLAAPEKHGAAEHPRQFKQTILKHVTFKVLQASRLVMTYRELIDGHLDRLPLFTDKDFAITVRALKSIATPDEACEMGPDLRDRIESIKEMLNDPEIVVKPIHERTFKTMVNERIEQKIIELSALTKKAKKKYIAKSMHLKEQKELAVINQEFMKKRKSPEETTITDEQALILEQLRFQDEEEGGSSELNAQYDDDEVETEERDGYDYDQQVDTDNDENNGAEIDLVVDQDTEEHHTV